MPTYEYVCDSCGHNFDVCRKMTDAPVKSCPECGSSVRQVFSAGFGLNFSGKGFYTTDTAKNAPAAPQKAGQEAKSPASCGCSCGCSCSS
ncbi:MAG: zinc ribbon domain-containing protein [Treponema sp.]